MSGAKLQELDWDYPDAFIVERTAEEHEADGYGHINNSIFLQWLDQCVWRHCDDVNITPSYCRELDRGFAAVRHEIDYLSSAYPGESIAIANWVTLYDQRLRSERRFQIIRIDDGRTLLRARSFYVCTKLSTGRPVKVPKEFNTGFFVSPNVAAALAAEEAKNSEG